MPTDTTVSNLIINKLTKQQYDDIQSPSETELYLVPEEIDIVPTSGSENPVESGGVYDALQEKVDVDQGVENAGKSLVVGSDGMVSPDTAPLSKLTASIPFGKVDSTSTSTVFTATVDGITELRDGICCYLMNGVVTSATNWTLNINGLGPKPVYSTMAAASRTTTLFNVAYTMLFVYNEDRVSGGCWDIFYGYNSNDNTIGYDIRRYYTCTTVPKTILYRYKLLFTCMDGKLLPVNTANNVTATTKELTQEEFDIFGEVFYYGTTTTVQPNAAIGNNVLFTNSTITLIDLRQSFNTGSTLVAGNDVYIVCVSQSNGSVKLASNPVAFALPSTEDGLLYKRIGKCYDTHRIILEQHKPIYYYKNGAIREWTNASETDISGKADKVVNAVSGNLAGLDSTGNLTDSGYAPSDFALNTHVTTKIVVSDIMQVPPRTLDNLQVGDIVVVDTDEGDETWIDERYQEYVVTYRNTSGESDTSSSDAGIEEQIYLTRVSNHFIHEVEYSRMYGSYDPQDDFDWDAIVNDNRPIYLHHRYGTIVNGTASVGNNTITAFNQPLSSTTEFVLEDYPGVVGAIPYGPAPNYRWSFNTGNAVPNITWPLQIQYWKGGSSPTIKPNTHYEITVVDWFAECHSTDSDTVDISGKADKVSGATNGNLAGLDATGNLTDSGKKASNFIDTSTTAQTKSGQLTVSSTTGNGIITGSTTYRSYTGISSIRECQNDSYNVNVAGFIINSDGASKFIHRRGAITNDEDAYMVFDATGMTYRASGTKGNTTLTDILSISASTNSLQYKGTEVALVTDIPSITGKADKVTGATNGNFAGLDSTGNLTDSGYNASDFVKIALTVEDVSELTATQLDSLNIGDTILQDIPNDPAFLSTIWIVTSYVNNSQYGKRMVIEHIEVGNDNKYQIISTISYGSVFDTTLQQYVWNTQPSSKLNRLRNTIDTSAITNINPAVIGGLNPGDIIIENNVTDNVSYTYIVTVKNDTTCGLLYSSANDIKLVIYEYESNAWSYTTTINCNISDKADKILKETSQPVGGMLPNTFYQYDLLSTDTTFLMAPATDNGIANVWWWKFTTSSTAITITWPAAITSWASGSAPTINTNKSYEVSVMDGVACIIES